MCVCVTITDAYPQSLLKPAPTFANVNPSWKAGGAKKAEPAKGYVG